MSIWCTNQAWCCVPRAERRLCDRTEGCVEDGRISDMADWDWETAAEIWSTDDWQRSCSQVSVGGTCLINCLFNKGYFCFFYLHEHMLGPALVAQWANTLAELQCGPGWLALWHGFDSCCRHVKSGLCMLWDWILGQVQRVHLCPLLKLWQAITPELGASGCGESRRCG